MLTKNCLQVIYPFRPKSKEDVNLCPRHDLAEKASHNVSMTGGGSGDRWSTHYPASTQADCVAEADVIKSKIAARGKLK